MKVVRKTKKKSKGVTMDFSETLDIWRPVKPVTVMMKITAVAEHDTDEKLVVDFKVSSGKYADKPVRDFLAYTGKAAFRLRNLLEALGQEIPEEAAELDFDELIGSEVGASLTPYDYEGKPQTRIEYCAVEDLDTDEDEVPAKKGKKAKEEEDDDDVKPVKKKKKPAKPDPDEEEEEEPAPKSKKGKGKKVQLTQEEIRDMDDEELQAVIDKNELEVDLSDFKTLKKQQAAVIDACEEAGILSEE